MMKTAFLTAALLAAAVAVAHSYLGERYILVRLFRKDRLPHLFGGSEFTRATMRFAWHITSIAWLGLAGVLLPLIWPGSVGVPEVVALTFAASGLLALVGSRGRHLSWAMFFAIAGLVWFGSR